MPHIFHEQRANTLRERWKWKVKIEEGNKKRSVSRCKSATNLWIRNLTPVPLHNRTLIGCANLSRDFHSGKLNFRKIWAGLPITLTMKMLYHSISALIYATVSMKTAAIPITHSLCFSHSLVQLLVRFKCETFMFFLRWNYEIVNARRNVDDIHWLTEFMHNSYGIFSLFLLRHHELGTETLAWWLRQSCYQQLAGYSFIW